MLIQRQKKPHPFSRIEDTFPLCKYNVDLNESVEKQAGMVAKKMIELQLPLSKMEVEVSMKLKPQFLGQCYNIVAKYCTVKREKYDHTGACNYILTMIPGNYDSFLSEMNQITKGEFEFDVDAHEAMATSSDLEQPKSSTGNPNKGGGGKGKKGKKV